MVLKWEVLKVDDAMDDFHGHQTTTKAIFFYLFYSFFSHFRSVFSTNIVLDLDEFRRFFDAKFEEKLASKKKRVRIRHVLHEHAS